MVTRPHAAVNERMDAARGGEYREKPMRWSKTERRNPSSIRPERQLALYAMSIR